MVRTLECKVDKKYPRADPNTPDMLVPLPSKKRTHDNISDTGDPAFADNPFGKRAKPATTTLAGNSAPQPTSPPMHNTFFNQITQPMQPMRSAGLLPATNIFTFKAASSAITLPIPTTLPAAPPNPPGAKFYTHILPGKELD